MEVWDNGQLLLPRKDLDPSAERLVLRLSDDRITAQDEEQGGEEQELQPEKVHFHPGTGQIVDGPDEGILSLELAQLKKNEEERRNYVTRCSCCGDRGGRFAEPVIRKLFSPMIGQRVNMVIEDPWCGVRPRNREKLASFIAAIEAANILIEDLRIVWNPSADVFQRPKEQIDDLHKKLEESGVQANYCFESRDKSQGHFHDRVVFMDGLDDQSMKRARWDITSGIDNLMSRQKECTVFREL